MGPRAGVDRCGKSRPHRDSIPGHVPRILHWLPTKKVKKVEEGQTFSDHTYPTVSDRRRGRCVRSLVRIGSEIVTIRYKQTNKQTNKQIRT